MDRISLIATTTFGLEAVASRELEALGYEPEIVSSGRVEFAGDASAIARANLWLRSADRVLLKVGQFHADDFGTLFDATSQLPWERWIGPEQAFPVRGRSVRSKLSSVPACQRIVKKAVVERLRNAHSRQTLPETGPEARIEIALLKDTATLTLDTTAAGLNKRGYRPIAGKAALKETLAAALVQLSFYAPDRPMLDPLCGTGTLCIEAAMIGRNIAPGLERTFAAEHWPTVDATVFRDARSEAREVIRPALEAPIQGSDIHGGALSLARRNAQAAGVADDITWKQADFRRIDPPEQYGVLITNPPYGQRVGEGDVRALYRDMPLVFRNLPTWSLFILTSDKAFERIVGRPADRRRKLYNGNIECTYYQFHGPPPPASPATARPIEQIDPAFGGLSDHAHQQAEAFANRIEKMARHRRRWRGRGIHCYRLYERDIPEVPLIVDRYEDALHIAEVDRPHERTPAQHADWIDLMCRTAAATLEIDPGKVFVKTRRRQRGLSQYERQAEAKHQQVVREGDLEFLVNLSDYLDTGLFLDHRITRSMVRDESAGKRVVNLFGYTGSFSVYAAAGGARQTVTVDLSNTYIEWARRNMTLNGFEGPAHLFQRANVAEWLGRLHASERFDLAIVDPPTFSNSKSTETDWDVQAHHATLLRELRGFMSPGGVIYFSTNYRRFKLDEVALKSADMDVRDITRQTIPEDFRNQRVHAAWRIVCP
ncbi:MAG: bifunctional 23S rRNA (guanine(2069)-N(7))-methyltransferase RlmK/23S rRNA (guanine(2445)-N(2))-methyltransferase RlmL [Planctomycetota bacterium]